MSEKEALKFIEANENDLEALLKLYNYYILNSTAHFDWHENSMETFKNRMYINHEKYKTYMVYQMDQLIGFCFLTPFRSKDAYYKTVEMGLYLYPDYVGQGYGKEIVSYLETIARQNGMEHIIVSISGENTASIRLFQNSGYEQCAHYKGIAEKFGRKLDLIDMQKALS